MRKEFFVIFLLLVLGFFFRLYNFHNFLYWSDDEQQQWYMLRHIIIDRHPSLVMPNAALGVGLNPLYHYFLVPFYIFSKFNPITLQTFGLLFYFANSVLLYFVGKLIAGRRVGLIATFFYTFSFTASLFDKRLWALSPNFFVVLLTIFSLVKINQKKYFYSFLLIPALVLPFSSDPSLGIVLLPIIYVLVRKIVLPKRIFFSVITLALLFLSPLAFFEIRHNFQNTRSLINTMTNYRGQAIREDVINHEFLASQLENFSRFFFLHSTQTAESVFCYCFLDDNIPSGFVLVILGAIVFFAYKSQGNKRVLLIFLISYVIGKYFFQEIFKGYPAFFYTIAISPVIFLIAAVVLAKLPKVTIGVVALFFLGLNLNSLVNSNFRYPLRDRLILAKATNAADYALYYSGEILVSGGGYNALFDYQGSRPKSGSLSLYWGHLYESYELYEFDKTAPSSIVIISESDIRASYPHVPLQVVKQGNLYVFIYDNSKKWFVPKAHLEKLYQSKYF